jgi:ATP-binding cassette subfamily B protein
MSSGNEAKSKRKRALRTVGRYLARYRRGIVVGGVCLVITNLLLLVTPWILKIAIDELKDGIAEERLLWLVIALIVATIVSGLFRFLMRRIMIGISRKIELDMRGDFFAHLERLSASFYNKHRTGDLMALATNDLNAVRSLVGPGVMYSMNTVVVGGMALSLMIVLSWKLTIVAILPLVILVGGMYHSMKLIHRYFERVQKRFGDLNSRAQENLAGIRVVRAYSRESHEIEEFEDQSRTYVKANMKLYRVQSLLQPLLTSVAGLGALFVLGYGGKQVIDEAITLGTFVAFSGYMAMLIWPMIALGWVMNIMERGLASMQRINVVMESEPDIKDIRDLTVAARAAGGVAPSTVAAGEARDVVPSAVSAPATSGAVPAAVAAAPPDRSIAFENVTFAYDTSTTREPVLRSLSFSVNDGETVAVVGPTGSGKSTLVSLILRLYDPQEGRVLVGGEPVDRIPLKDLRSLIGLIPQDIFLFSDTIAENMAFGVTSLDEDALDRLSRLAAIHDEIKSFPKGYKAMIGERGINLSGGQKQRLAIARAVAKDPGILILDDALSSVDTDTEERILGSLRAELKTRTSILISHRISTVREADRIFVLADGHLVEQGTHNDLIASGGVYADMYNKQQIMYNLERS